MALEVTLVLLSAQLVDSTVRKRAEESLKQFQEQNLPVFLLSLSLELACEWKPVDSRKLAGLVLKNALDSKEQQRKDELVQRWLSLDVAVKSQIKSCLLRTLSSTAAEARSTVSQVIAKVACIELPQKQWPELVGYLLSNICDVPPHVKQATIETLGYLCEEVAPNVIDHDQVYLILTAFVHGMNASEGGSEVRVASTRALYNSLGFMEVALRSSLLPDKESVSDEEWKSLSEAEKAPVGAMADTRKADCKKGKMKDVGKPKMPATPFFVFVEDASEMYKEKHPINKNVSALWKAAGEKWNAMSEAEKAPFVAKAEKRKAEYERNLEVCSKDKRKAEYEKNLQAHNNVPDKPKRPASPFEDVIEMYKEKNPNNKNVSALRKAAGEKWKSMSVAEKYPFMGKLEKRRAECKKNLEACINKHKRKAEYKKNLRAYNKVSDKPKRPASSFFVFMEDFRKKFKEKHPHIKAVSVVGKAGGEKWKLMSEAEKAPFVAKAKKRKAEYEKLLQSYNKKIREGTCAYDKSDKLKYEVNDYKDDDEDGCDDDDDGEGCDDEDGSSDDDDDEDDDDDDGEGCDDEDGSSDDDDDEDDDDGSADDDEDDHE